MAPRAITRHRSPTAKRRRISVSRKVVRTKHHPRAIMPAVGCGVTKMVDLVTLVVRRAVPVTLGLVLVLHAILPLVAFESHVMNVTAQISPRCQGFETRSMGFWKNHTQFMILPQTLGSQNIITISQALGVYNLNDSVMRNKLMKQLLALKFNISYFGVGSQVPLSESITIDALAAAADALLLQPSPSNSDLEAMKNRVEAVNTLEGTVTCQKPLLLINKIYYNVASVGRGNRTDNQWVEIYNPSESPISLSGWQICNAQACDTFGSNLAAIPSHGFAVVTNKATTWAYWFIPPGTVKIVLNSQIGGGLDTNTDMVFLKAVDGTIVDQMNYGSPSTSWSNYNAGVWSPGVSTVAQGDMLARKPTGFDTDQPSDWVELGPPTLSMLYPDANTSVWHWGQNVNITWTAHNHNGPDGDLAIDIYYIQDDNQNHVINVGGGDSMVTLASHIANSGSFNYTVPSGFVGDVWVVIVATGPENFMTQTMVLSRPIYDPPEWLMKSDPKMVLDQIDQLPPTGCQDPAALLNQIVQQDQAANPAVTADAITSGQELPVSRDEIVSPDNNLAPDQGVTFIGNAEPVVEPVQINPAVALVCTPPKPKVDKPIPPDQPAANDTTIAPPATDNPPVSKGDKSTDQPASPTPSVDPTTPTTPVTPPTDTPTTPAPSTPSADSSTVTPPTDSDISGNQPTNQNTTPPAAPGTGSIVSPTTPATPVTPPADTPPTPAPIPSAGDSSAGTPPANPTPPTTIVNPAPVPDPVITPPPPPVSPDPSPPPPPAPTPTGP